MPRGPRLDTPLAVHHVWNRGIERCDIFRDDDDRRNFLARIERSVRDRHLAIYAWALMPNHFHLLTRTGNLGLSATMRAIEGGYANYFNARHQRAGHLFQNRFKNTLVGEDPYFLELLRYIHLNPLRAGIVANLDDLDRYPWTGHAAMLGHQLTPWHDIHSGLLHFGPKSTRVAAYREFVANGLNYPKCNLDGGGMRRSLRIWQYLNPIARGREAWSFDERILGSSSFVDAVLAEVNDEPSNGQVGFDHAACVDHMLVQIAARTGVPLPLLRSNCKRPDAVRARQALCYLAICHAAVPARQLGMLLGIHPSTALRNAAAGESVIAKLGLSSRQILPEVEHPF